MKRTMTNKERIEDLEGEVAALKEGVQPPPHPYWSVLPQVTYGHCLNCGGALPSGYYQPQPGTNTTAGTNT